MDRALRKRAGVAVTAVALAASVSALFGGVAFAHSHGGFQHNERTYKGGDGAPGGDTAVNCPIPITLNLGLLGQAGGDETCNTSGSLASPGAPGATY